jgi:hypothetical protein
MMGTSVTPEMEKYQEDTTEFIERTAYKIFYALTGRIPNE